jgi:predicted MFS family arabinose efflux permease
MPPGPRKLSTALRSPAVRQVGLLAACQALLLTNNVTLIAINALAGFALAADKSLATLPVTAYVLGSALSTIPASLAMKRLGRRLGFTLGGMCGIAGSLLAAYAMWAGSLALLCLATFVSGIYNAFGQYYRFAAADVADAYDKNFKERAISLVLAGGIVGGIVGPETSKLTRNLFPTAFAGCYAALAIFAVLSMLLVQRLRLPDASHAEMHGASRPLWQIMRQPAFVVAVLGGMIGYGVMNLLMVATPLAMQVCSYPYGDVAFILEWHVIGMFLPSFFTGSLIKRFGVLPVMIAGALVMFACIAIALSGVAISNFWFALVLLGIGWNFLYIGGTNLLTTIYAPAEKAKTQGINDFLVYATMMASSFSSGVLVSSSGWHNLNFIAIPFVAVAAFAAMGLALQRRRHNKSALHRHQEAT